MDADLSGPGIPRRRRNFIMMELVGVTKLYQQGRRSVQAVRGVSLSIEPGEYVSIMGPSGSGKSTLMHMMGALDTPTTGHALFGGRDLHAMSDRERTLLRRTHMGFVFQFFNLLPTLTAAENVALPLLLGGTRRAAALAEARAWFGRLGLDGLGTRRSGELSGGQAQRVALARGMVARPEVLFADEPTGSLDSVAGELVMSLMTRAAREQGTTVILVTHDARVAAYAGREVIVRDGTVTSLTGATPSAGATR
jgi:putative ABC transport system ATP-binding protein